MTDRFDAINLGEIPVPDIVEEIDFESLLADRKAKMRIDLASILPNWNPDLESDPIVILLEESTYREVILRQRINEAARAVMLAHAVGADLDNLAAGFKVKRQTIMPADDTTIPPTPAIMESDTALRSRILLAFEALSVAGPDGAYRFHSFSANPFVADVAVHSPEPGEVVVTIMTTDNDGIPSQAVLADVTAVLTDEDVRPLTDHVTIQPATAINYSVEARLQLYDGPDAEIVRTASIASLESFITGQRRLGEPITIDGLHKAARVNGVKKVELFQPDTETKFSDVNPDRDQFAHCTGFTVIIAGAA